MGRRYRKMTTRRLAAIAATANMPQLAWFFGPEYGLLGIGCGITLHLTALIALRDKYEGGEMDA